MLTPKDIAELIVKTIDGKKAHDIKLLRTTDVTVLADYFVICTATSTTQIKTLADEVEAVLEAQGEEAPPRRSSRRRLGPHRLRLRCGPPVHGRGQTVL